MSAPTSAAHVDVVVIGGGILGLAQAWMAARRGLSVVLLERTAAAEGASIRNFGMIWPIGQTGDAHAIALRSREFWLELGQLGVVDVRPCGSIHLAHRPDEIAVHEEFRARGTHSVRMLTPAEIAGLTPLANTGGLLGGFHSASELRVDPRVASARIADWLAETQRVECRFNTPAVAVDGRTVHASDGRSWRGERVVVCSGSDLRTLFPVFFETCGLVPCKLQMLRSVAPPSSLQATPHLASGLTLRHYAAFAGCPSLAALKARVAAESRELDRLGIHVMASAFADGVVIGDSHEYGREIAPFDKSLIDDLILRESRTVFHLADWTIRERWHGVYVKHPSSVVIDREIAPGVHAFTGVGGAGMTMAFGLADRAWSRENVAQGSAS